MHLKVILVDVKTDCRSENQSALTYLRSLTPVIPYQSESIFINSLRKNLHDYNFLTNQSAWHQINTATSGGPLMCYICFSLLMCKHVFSPFSPAHFHSRMINWAFTLFSRSSVIRMDKSLGSAANTSTSDNIKIPRST